MLRLPLRKKILIIMDSGLQFICRVVSAQEDVITVVDLQLRVLTPTGDFLHNIKEMSGKFYFARSKIVGYSPLYGEAETPEENKYRSELLTKYSTNLADTKRKKFKIIKNIDFIDGEKNVSKKTTN